MGILARFTSKKEQEISSKVAAAPAEAKKPAAKKKAAAVKAPKADTKKEAAVGKAGAMTSDLVDILRKPLVTEKSAIQASHGQYAFRVAMDANRIQVRNAVKAMYGILPTSVNIQRVRGKFVRFGQKSGMRQTWKKAIVTLPAGKTIDVHSGV